LQFIVFVGPSLVSEHCYWHSYAASGVALRPKSLTPVSPQLEQMKRDLDKVGANKKSVVFLFCVLMHL